jgi:hypothetical protein
MKERVLPRDFEHPPEYIIPLSSKELQELGTFTAIWSQIDQLMVMLASELGKCDRGAAFLMMETMTTGPKVSVLKRLCKRDGSSTATKIYALLDRNGGLIEDRNHIIHGIWAIRWDKSSDYLCASSNYSKNKTKPKDATKLEELSDRAAKFSSDLGQLLAELNTEFVGKRPRHLFTFAGGGPPEGKPPPPWPPADI